MAKRKSPESRFVLEEKNGIVIASIIDENDYSMQHTISNMPHPKVRAPRRTKAEIEDDSKFFASMFNQTQEEYLRKNIEGINQEINKHIQEIRKELKRIQSLTHYVVNAKEVLEKVVEKST